MFPELQRRLIEFSNKDRSTLFRTLSLLFGATVFLVVVPWALATLVGMIIGPIAFRCPRTVELVIGFVFNTLGLFLAFWSVLSLWLLGKGTPVPVAPTQRLVVEGPYRLCRNPMKLGGISYYLGIGTLFDSLETGIICFFVGLAIGTFYHKAVEEKELLTRFGKDYEEYKKSTPLLIPRFHRHSSFEVSTEDTSS
jgi:protein-S-isoprenylcysteine O-methyltransferase Ste14